MTTQTIQFDAVSLTDIGSGAITAQLLDGGSNPMLAAIAESAVRGRYTGTVTNHVAGSFELLIFWDGKRVGRYSTVPLLAADGTYEAKDTVDAVLDTAGREAIAEAVDTKLSETHGAESWEDAGGGGGGAGTGARTVTVTVNDGTDALQNATVRMTEGVNTYTALTNASGVAVFNLDDATYIVSISKAGYSYSGTTLVVDGTESATYSMTAVAITPGADNLTTAWLVTRVAGVATAGITIRYQQQQAPDDDTGSSYDATIRNVDSDDDGVVELPMVRGGYYFVWRGTGKRPDDAQLIEIPADAGSTYELPSHVGR